MKLVERLRSTAILVVVAYLALRVIITLASPHPLLVDMPEACEPSSQNCARLDLDGGHRMDGVSPLVVSYGAEAEFWEAVEAWAAEEPRTSLLHEEANFRHYAVQTEFWGFVDGVTVSIDQQSGEVVLQSQSRIGLSDLGVNPERLTSMAAALTPQ